MISSPNTLFRGPIAQLVRAPPLQDGGLRFESWWDHQKFQGSIMMNIISNLRVGDDVEVVTNNGTLKNVKVCVVEFTTFGKVYCSIKTQDGSVLRVDSVFIRKCS